MLSRICETFHCDPDRAETLDWYKIGKVYEVRAAEAAVDAVQGDDKEAVKRNPELIKVYGRLVDAQKSQSELEESVDAMSELVKSLQLNNKQNNNLSESEEDEDENYIIGIRKRLEG